MFPKTKTRRTLLGEVSDELSWQLRHSLGFPLRGRRPIATDCDRFDWLELGGARETDLSRFQRHGIIRRPASLRCVLLDLL